MVLDQVYKWICHNSIYYDLIAVSKAYQSSLVTRLRLPIRIAMSKQDGRLQSRMSAFLPDFSCGEDSNLQRENNNINNIKTALQFLLMSTLILMRRYIISISKWASESH